MDAICRDAGRLELIAHRPPAVEEPMTGADSWNKPALELCGRPACGGETRAHVLTNLVSVGAD